MTLKRSLNSVKTGLTTKMAVRKSRTLKKTTERTVRHEIAVAADLGAIWEVRALHAVREAKAPVASTEVMREVDVIVAATVVNVRVAVEAQATTTEESVAKGTTLQEVEPPLRWMPNTLSYMLLASREASVKTV